MEKLMINFKNNDRGRDFTLSRIVNDLNFFQVKGFDLDHLFIKLEALNPAGSVKMKAALGMVEDIEVRNQILPETILIESSSGSLGVALSIICAERGYHFTCVVDPNTSAQNVKMMKALGTQVVVIDKRDENGGFLGSRIAYIHQKVKEDSRYLWLNQYANPENPLTHSRMTAKAIADTFEHVDYLFVGAGTTGTLMGCVNYFQSNRPKTKIIAVDSVGSVTFGFPANKRYIPGLGSSRRPEIYSPNGIYDFVMVPEVETVRMCHYLAKSNGLLAGGSTGTVLAGVKAWQARIPHGATVVAISPDLGERYLDTIYDEAWVENRFGKIVSYT